MKIKATLLMSFILMAQASIASANQITNGDFASGNTGFTSDYTVFAGAPPDMGESRYGIGTSPSLFHSGFANFAAQSPATNMMVVNGAATPGLRVWSQDVAVTPNTDYFFSTFVASVCCTNELAQLQFNVNGSQIGLIFTAPNSVGTWGEFFATWNSGANTTATLSIVNQNTVLGGNDFALTLLALDTQGGGGTNTSTPEPGAMVLLGSGLAVLVVLHRRK